MSGPVEIVIILAVVGYVLARRLVGEPAEGKRMLLLPAILVAVGLADATSAAQSPVSIGFLAGSAAASVVIGLLRGASIRVFERDGVVFMRYTVTTVILWVGNLAIKFGGSLVLGILDPKAEHAAGNGLMLTLGAGMLVEGLAVLSKATRSSGRIVWQKGKDGEPHQSSPFLDGLQEKVRTTDWSSQRRDRGGFSSLLSDLRELDFRRPPTEDAAPRPGSSSDDGRSRTANEPGA